MQGGDSEVLERAVATYPARHWAGSAMFRDGDKARCGRGSDREIWLGYAPRSDQASPRVAHQQVATALNYHTNTVRNALYEIYNKMFEQQIPMPDVTDKRFAVVDAARAHGLLTDR